MVSQQLEKNRIRCRIYLQIIRTLLFCNMIPAQYLPKVTDKFAFLTSYGMVVHVQ
jgi:hypothetical protein